MELIERPVNKKIALMPNIVAYLLSKIPVIGECVNALLRDASVSKLVASTRRKNSPSRSGESIRPSAKASIGASAGEPPMDGTSEAGPVDGRSVGRTEGENRRRWRRQRLRPKRDGCFGLSDEMCHTWTPILFKVAVPRSLQRF